MSKLPAPSAKRVIADMKELARLTSNAQGAQRVAWGPVFRQAREWFRKKVKSELGLPVEVDAAGNQWVTLPGRRKDCVLVAGHLDSVPNGGWLDGCLGTLSALEVLRRHAAAGGPPVTLKLVDWADEEGARFGRSLMGSSAAGGSLNIEEVRHLKDRDGVSLPDALKENGVNLNTMLRAHKELKKIPAKAYLELHIEQGPVLEAMNKPTGVVLGTFGVERHLVRFTGQAAHSGSTPIPMRKDAFLAAAQFALQVREIGKKYSKPGANVVCTCGVVKVEPCIVTAVPGVCEISIDQRALNAKILARMLKDAKTAAAKAAKDNNVTFSWNKIWTIEPRLFDKKLIALGKEAVREITGDAPVLPSGPLHDAAEMVPHMPTVMMFAYSARGLSHCKEEDTPIKHLDATIRSFLLMADKVVAHTAKS
ncbi:MAG TPA: Zn-dependent hydrolase [Kiritimatiellia bacterium]|nr:Zn-dependent hydrolase [Kiritimatiellia bacterium]HMO99024.1 Zn-dependent hydrolase [Kiritimatiellia bacterium]HMP96100.1 Zn-dependent hydrolase [Kiritimatiellia bacterium]